MDYQSFLVNKQVTVETAGFEVNPDRIHLMLFPFQRAIVQWALKLGKAAVFSECGTGKTLIQLSWADNVAEHAGGKVLIAAPLAVAHQTVAEGRKIDVAVRYCRDQASADAAEERIVITNYDMLKEFDPARFVGIVLDESSILKSFTGTTKRQILSMFEDTPYKLACTATPAPNDVVELGNHAAFLNIMTSGDMLTRWFINDTQHAQTFRLKGHAVDDFWQWVASWAVCISKPSDLGYSDEGFILPELRLHSEVVDVDHTRAFDSGQLFLNGNLSATDMWKEKRATAIDRCQRASEIMGDSPEHWIIWCDTNFEADILKGLFPEAIEVRGSESIKAKEEKLTAFSEGRAQVIVTKSGIAGLGLNWQHCHNQIFVGLTYSFEAVYQALRRSWRYGQTKPVDAYLVYAESEGNILSTIQAKQEAHQEMQAAMSKAMRINGISKETDRRESKLDVETDVASGDGWEMRLGDSVTEIKTIPDNSVDMMIFSPPFSNQYTYSDSLADMGNCDDDQHFFEHFGYLIPELLRVLKPGRICCVHTKDQQLFKNRDGAAGLRDFTGELTRAFVEAGWTYHSKITIWKDPVQEMHRTQTHGLLYKNFRTRGEVCRQGMAEYVVVFRKWADGMDEGEHVLHPREDWPLPIWQRYASPVWFDIDQTDVLNGKIAKEDKDEKHLAPLQLGVIRRCIELWTNPGELVFSPFAGIGSEGYGALELNRRFVGVELKRSYWELALKHLDMVVTQKTQMGFPDHVMQGA